MHSPAGRQLNCFQFLATKNNHARNTVSTTFFYHYVLQGYNVSMLRDIFMAYEKYIMPNYLPKASCPLTVTSRSMSISSVIPVLGLIIFKILVCATNTQSTATNTQNTAVLLTLVKTGGHEAHPHNCTLHGCSYAAKTHWHIYTCRLWDSPGHTVG